jgi:hypothetical protein
MKITAIFLSVLLLSCSDLLPAQFIADSKLNTCIQGLSGSAQSIPMTGITESGRTAAKISTF